MANREDYPYLDNINTIKIYNFNGNLMSLFDFTSWTNNQTATPYYTCDFSEHSIISNGLDTTRRLNPSSSGTFVLPTNTFIRIDVTTTNNGAEVTYSNYDIVTPFLDATCPQFFTSVYQGVQTGFYYKGSSTPTKPIQSIFNSISDAIQYIYEHYALIDLYVDGENWVKSSPGPSYSWEAVEFISGRLGTLNLTQIKSDSINDGAAVTGASSSSFDNLVEANNLKVLIDDILPEPEPTGTDVTVRYTINSASAGSYTYCKLVVKKNKIPNDVTDGDKIINIDPTAVSVLVKNLKGHTKYYFVIFVKDSNDIEASSEPKSITTQGAVIPEEYQPYLDLLALTAWGTNSDMNLLAYANRRGNSSTSIVSSDHSFITSGNFNANQYNYGFSVLELSTINISTDPVTVLYTCNVAEYDIIKTSGRDMWGVYSENGNGADYIQTWGSITGVSSPGNTDGLRFNPTTSFNSLGDCLAYLTQHFRHVNVKVDGEYWLRLD